MAATAIHARYDQGADVLYLWREPLPASTRSEQRAGGYTLTFPADGSKCVALHLDPLGDRRADRDKLAQEIAGKSRFGRAAVKAALAAALPE